MNLLTDPLIRVRIDTPDERDVVRTVTLPRLLELLGQDAVAGYPGIQKHQEDAFHVFLCLLAGAALARAGRASPGQDENFWRDALVDLADDAGVRAWDLVADDPSRPAFMQPPVPPDHWEKASAKEPILAPDQLDLLPTGRNHDVKRTRAANAHPDAWIFALVSLQTMSGFFGKGNYGICRMNSGFGNRVVAEVVHSLRAGARWQHAVQRLPEHRAVVLAGQWGYRDGGIVLLWIVPWDGETSVTLAELDPFFIEVCRRVRLSREGHRLTSHVVPAKRSRVQCDALKGVVGDPWTPVDLTHKNGPVALTVPSTGLGVSVLHRVVFAHDVQETMMHRPLSSVDGNVSFSISVLVRGQGKTEGFHHELVPVPARVRHRLFGGSGSSSWRQQAALLGRQALADANAMRLRVLKPAVFSLVLGGPAKVDLSDDTVDAWWARIDRHFLRAWRDQYFPWIWSLGERCNAENDLPRWHGILAGAAREAFELAVATLPRHSGRRYRSLAVARSRLEGTLARLFPAEKEVHDDTPGTATR